MKRLILVIITAALAAGAHAAGFTDLDIKASALKKLHPVNDIPIPAPAAVTDAVSASRFSAKWYGADSRQARMQFTTYMLYKIPDDYTGPASRILSDPEQFQITSELVKLQLQHMYGAFTMHPGFTENPGIPSGDYKINLIRVEKVPNQPYVKIFYSYDDIVVFSSELFSGGAARIQFVLPADPVTIYSKGFPTPQSKINRCTDKHYNSEGDFWYFWNPYQEGCPITNNDVVTVRTTLKPMRMTRGTYPEYAKLYGENGNGDVLQVSYLVGIDENFRNGDLGRKTFNDAFAGLKAAGFRATVDKPRRKRLTFRTGGKRTSIEMLLLDPNTTEFSQKAVYAMQISDIFLYDGHSGLGGYLDPNRLAQDTGRPLALPKDKYQIFAFQGCSTYAYYNSAFFKLKRSSLDPRGTKNLDILTTGIGADFEVGANVDVVFLASLTMGDRPSWQTIINRLHSTEEDSSSLIHINGDEDNPRMP